MIQKRLPDLFTKNGALEMPAVADHPPLEKYQMTKTQCLAKTCVPPLALERRLSELDFPVTQQRISLCFIVHGNSHSRVSAMSYRLRHVEKIRPAACKIGYKFESLNNSEGLVYELVALSVLSIAD